MTKDNNPHLGRQYGLGPVADTDLTYGYGEPTLRSAFEKVQDAENWKNPIDAVVLADDVSVTAAAIVFFTGSVPTCTAVYDRPGHIVGYIVRADGYYEAVGA